MLDSHSRADQLSAEQKQIREAQLFPLKIDIYLWRSSLGQTSRGNDRCKQTEKSNIKSEPKGLFEERIRKKSKFRWHFIII